MNTPKSMVIFHVSFLLLSMLSLFLMASKFIQFDFPAFWTVVIAIFLNAFFGVLWIDEANKRRVEKQEVALRAKHVFPMISFIVTAHNEERNIMRSVNDVFKCAESFHGPSEIIIVDDGSTDKTFEVAWATVNSKQRELAHIPAKVVGHMSKLGKVEVMKTGVNKAMGEYIALLDVPAFCNPAWLSNLVDYICATGNVAASCRAQPSPDTTTVVPSMIWLYRADALRRLLNEKGMKNAAEIFEIERDVQKKKK